MIFNPYELNYSKVNAYLYCPALYKFIYDERKFAPPTAPSSLGSSVHRALARFHQDGGGLGELLRYYQDAWVNKGYESPGQTMEYYARGRAVLERWHGYYLKEQPSVKFSEKFFDVPFEKWSLRGTIDRVDDLGGGEAEVIDYKMGFEGKTEEDVLKSLQLSLYGFAAGLAFGLRIKRVGYMVLTEMRKIMIPYDPEAGEKALNLCRDTGNKILNREFDPTGDCSKCPVKTLCCHSPERVRYNEDSVLFNSPVIKSR